MSQLPDSTKLKTPTVEELFELGTGKVTEKDTITNETPIEETMSIPEVIWDFLTHTWFEAIDNTRTDRYHGRTTEHWSR